MNKKAAAFIAAILLTIGQPAFAGVSPWPSDLNNPSGFTPQTKYSSPAQPEQPYSAPAGMKQFSGCGLSMTYPSAWQDVGINLPPQVIFAKILPTASSMFRDNLSIACENIGQHGNITLDAYYNANLQELSKTPGFRKISETDGTTGGIPNKGILYSIDAGGGNQLFQMQFYIINGGYGYVITLTAIQNTIQNAAQEAGKALNTIQFR
ncbi:MAG: DUF1795 domain-containing protein [bacterium]|nr:DUF1795 domain-containing protein [bacterium]